MVDLNEGERLDDEMEREREREKGNEVRLYIEWCNN